MCLKACRRLPLNAPCVSLRLSQSTPQAVKKEAVAALLSGGAHPILFHDKKMVEGIIIVSLDDNIKANCCPVICLIVLGLYEALCQSYTRSSVKNERDLMRVARNFSCDGCYEPMFTGMSEFKFAYVFLLKVRI